LAPSATPANAPAGATFTTPALFAFRENVVLFYILVPAVHWCQGAQLPVFASAAADLEPRDGDTVQRAGQAA